MKNRAMNIPSIGKFLRKLRIDHEEILMDMADKLEVSPSFLSAIENGKKLMPKKWFNKLTELYSLNEEQQQNLKQAIEDSKHVIELNLKNASPKNREFALLFAREFEQMDDETREKMLNILKDKRKVIIHENE